MQLSETPLIAPLQAGNDGVGGIEWRLPTSEPDTGFKQAGAGALQLPAPGASRPPSPIMADSSRVPARSSRGGRPGRGAAVLTLTPFAQVDSGKLVALKIEGGQPGVIAWLAIATQPRHQSASQGLLGFLPEKVIPLGPVDAHGKLLVQLPVGLQLDGLVVQVVLREAQWASSKPFVSKLPATESP